MMSERHWWGGGADKIRRELPWTTAQKTEFVSIISNYKLRETGLLLDV